MYTLSPYPVGGELMCLMNRAPTLSYCRGNQDLHTLVIIYIYIYMAIPIYIHSIHTLIGMTHIMSNRHAQQKYG